MAAKDIIFIVETQSPGTNGTWVQDGGILYTQKAVDGRITRLLNLDADLGLSQKIRVRKFVEAPDSVKTYPEE